MKKLAYLGSISAVAAMILVGCGGGGGSSASVSGTVEASYLAGVKVCAKGTDKCTVTDSNGKFTLGVSAPVELEIRVGNSVVGHVNVDSSNVKVTPAVLANNNPTVAAYLGTMLHIMGGCKITDNKCNLGNVSSVDIDPTKDKPLVEELTEAVEQNSEGNISIKVNNEGKVVTNENVTLYQNINPLMVGMNEVYYHGVASGEGFLQFKIDPEMLKLAYTVYDLAGNIEEKGEEQLINVYKNVFFKFKGESDSGMFVSGGLAVGYYIENNKVYYQIGLQYRDKNLTAKDVKLFANKTYNSLYFDTDGTIEFDIVDLNNTNPQDLNGTWSSLDGNGTWVVEESHIKFFENDGSVAAIGFFRPGVSRAAIVYGDMEGGYGVGLEAKPLTPEELKGTFYYSDNENDVQCFGQVTVDGTNFNYEDEICTDNEPESGSGTLVLNPNVNINGTNVTLNGMAQVEGANEFVFIDPVDGYYISLDTDTKSLSIGSNKPLK